MAWWMRWVFGGRCVVVCRTIIRKLREAVVRWVVVGEAQHRVRRAEPSKPSDPQATGPMCDYRSEL
jgi:hypothetical protein